MAQPQTAVDISGIDIAAKRHIGRKIWNCEYKKPTLIGLMRHFDTYYNSPSNVRITSLDIDGGAMAFTFWAGIPSWAGIDPLNPDYSQRRLNIVQSTKLIDGTLLPSAAQMGEAMDKYKLNRFKSDEQLDKYTMQVGDRAAEAFNILLDAWLWPGHVSVGGSGNGPGNKAQFMQWDYCLQNGFAGNDPANAANAFVYLGIDMHQFPEAKAINVGTDAAPWTLSEEALYTDLIMPIRDRGANIDMIVAGKKGFARLRQLLANKILPTPEKTMHYAGPYFQIDDGIFVIYESAIDRATTNDGRECLYIGDSSTIRFGLDPEGVSSMTLVKDWVEMPSAYLLQGYAETAWVNECPRFWGRAYNLVVA